MSHDHREEEQRREPEERHPAEHAYSDSAMLYVRC